MTDRPTPVWVLADDRAGNVSQCLGVAEALGLPFLRKEVRYAAGGGLPNMVRGASLLGIAAASRGQLAPPWPQVVIAAGRRVAPVARWLKRASGCLLVQIMDPGPPGRGEFDLIAVPVHDRAVPAGANVLPITGAPHRVTPERLAAEAAIWRPRLAHLPAPRIAVLVGGAAKGRAFTPAHARALAGLAAAAARSAGGGLMVSTSRRTGSAAEAVLLDALPEPRHVYRWSDGGDNPYFGYLGLADAVIVTGDSVSMLSEACATPGPVWVFAPEGMVSAKHARLHRSLYDQGYARPLDGTWAEWQHERLNPAGAIAARIRDLLERRR